MLYVTFFFFFLMNVICYLHVHLISCLHLGTLIILSVMIPTSSHRVVVGHGGWGKTFVNIIWKLSHFN